MIFATEHGNCRRLKATSTSSACAGGTRSGGRETRHPPRIRHDRRPAEHRLARRLRRLDAKGFIKTGADLSPDDMAAARCPGPSPDLLETSLPGVFAVGDVRGGNIERVASAVGEGSIAVAFVHQVLHE